MPRMLCATLIIMLLPGCAAQYSPQAQQVREAHESEVENCQRIGEVYGSASGFHWSQGEAMQSARNQALERARERNATHLVWRHAEDSITPQAQGVAYRCPE